MKWRKCAICGKASSDVMWNMSTREECITKEMHEDYMSISNDECRLERDERFYKCPVCKRIMDAVFITEVKRGK